MKFNFGLKIEDSNLQILAPKLVNFYIRARDHFWSHILFIRIMHADCYFLHT